MAKSKYKKSKLRSIEYIANELGIQQESEFLSKGKSSDLWF